MTRRSRRGEAAILPQRRRACPGRHQADARGHRQVPEKPPASRSRRCRTSARTALGTTGLYGRIAKMWSPNAPDGRQPSSSATSRPASRSRCALKSGSSAMPAAERGLAHRLAVVRREAAAHRHAHALAPPAVRLEAPGGRLVVAQVAQAVLDEFARVARRATRVEIVAARDEQRARVAQLPCDVGLRRGGRMADREIETLLRQRMQPVRQVGSICTPGC